LEGKGNRVSNLEGKGGVVRKWVAMINKKYFSLALIFLGIWGLAGVLRLQYVTEHSVQQDFVISVLQGNIPQELKWEETMLDSTFVIYEDLSRQAKDEDDADLIIYPEAALPTYLLLWVGDYYRLKRFVDAIQTPIFVGFPHAIREIKYKGQTEPVLYYNAANLFDFSIMRNENYYKNILVPFGERTPFLDKVPILWKLQMGQANFESGKSTVIYDVGDYNFAPLICFEVVFPLFLRNIAHNFNPDFWVNITNDAWFYRSIGTHQHAKMAVFRTIETRKPVFRAANTGYSFYTTPNGEIHGLTNLFERTLVSGNLTIFSSVTPYVKYGYLISLIFFIFFALQIIGIFIIWFKRKK
jgi:apolipoprotein N-acyltransferase